MEEISLDQRDLGSTDISNNYPVSRECENHKVGREEVEEVFLEDNVKSVFLSFGIVRQHNDTGACLSQQSVLLVTLSLHQYTSQLKHPLNCIFGAHQLLPDVCLGAYIHMYSTGHVLCPVYVCPVYV